MPKSNSTSRSTPAPPAHLPAQPNIAIRPDGTDVHFVIPLERADEGRYTGVLLIGETPHFLEAIEVKEEGDLANVAVNPEHQAQVDRALDMCGDGPLSTTRIDGKEYVIVLYPFTE